MPSKLRVGVLGLTHDHIWHHTADLSSDDISVVHVADPHKDLIDKFCSQVQVGESYSRAEDLIDREQLDFVMIYTDNRQAAQLAVRAMRRGLHVMVEKPMASTLEEADLMFTTAAETGVNLMVNWPVAWYPSFRFALRLAQEGRIGRITHIDFRAAHIGPKEFGCSPYFYEWLHDPERNGGGALMDYCCYGAMACRFLLGLPYRVYAVAGRLQKDYIGVEDNAQLVMQYPQALGTAQASWSQVGPGMGAGPIIYGSAGTIVVHQRAGSREGHVIKEGLVELMTLERPEGEVLDSPDLPEGERSALDYFLSRLRDGLPIEGPVSPLIGRDVQQILEAGYRSVRSGCDISLPLRVGTKT